MLTVFSGFPLGLATLPDDTAPLAARLPLTYEPLLPLTRTVQKAGAVAVGVEWKNRIRVLVAECIPASDPVGRISRDGWRIAQDTLKGVEGLSLHAVQTPSMDDLREAVSEHSPDLLIISAHGTLVANTRRPSSSATNRTSNSACSTLHPSLCSAHVTSLPGDPAPSPSPISCCARAHWPYWARKCPWTCAAT